MADQLRTTRPGETHHQQMTGKTVVLASLAGVAVGGPLLGMMGFSFLATLTLLLITSPLFILFSPLLLAAAFVIGASLVGFALAATMAIAGLSALGWVFKSFKPLRAAGLEWGVTVSDKLMDAGEDVKEKGKDWAGFLQQKVQNPEQNKPNRG